MLNFFKQWLVYWLVQWHATCTTKLYNLKKIYVKVCYGLYRYCIIVRQNYPSKHFAVQSKVIETLQNGVNYVQS